MSIGQHDSRPKKSARILLVDDNVHGLSARRQILEELGHAVTAKTCPLEAADCFSAGAFDLLITDYRMPGMDGAALIAKVREHRPDLPVVLVSGFADTLGLSEVNTGANAVVQKSQHEVQIMLRAVDRLLSTAKVKPPNSRKPPGLHRAMEESEAPVVFAG